MTGIVVAGVLFAALLHASWNAAIKSRGDIFLTTVLVAAGAGFLSALALPFLTAPAPASWPYIALSSLIQFGYYALLVTTYRSGDMSHAYPLMRGTPPLLIAAVSWPLMDELLTPTQWLAIGSICGGILALFFTTQKNPATARRTTFYALVTACVIASYTMIDGVGVRLAGATVAYTMWLFVFTALALVLWALRTRPGQLGPYAKANPGMILLGGGASLCSYVIVLWAMTQAPVAAVSALRETSILFAVAIAALVLREKISPTRLGAISLIGAGAVLMRLG